MGSSSTSPSCRWCPTRSCSSTTTLGYATTCTLPWPARHAATTINATSSLGTSPRNAQATNAFPCTSSQHASTANGLWHATTRHAPSAWHDAATWVQAGHATAITLTHLENVPADVTWSVHHEADAS